MSLKVFCECLSQLVDPIFLFILFFGFHFGRYVFIVILVQLCLIYLNVVHELFFVVSYERFDLKLLGHVHRSRKKTSTDVVMLKILILGDIEHQTFVPFALNRLAHGLNHVHSIT